MIIRQLEIADEEIQQMNSGEQDIPCTFQAGAGEDSQINTPGSANYLSWASAELFEEATAYFDSLYAGAPIQPKELADPSSYNEDSTLKAEFLPKAIVYAWQIAQFRAKVNHTWRKVDGFIKTTGEQEERAHRALSSLMEMLAKSQEQKMQMIAKYKTEMEYEWTWDNLKQERIRQSVPKRV